MDLDAQYRPLVRPLDQARPDSSGIAGIHLAGCQQPADAPLRSDASEDDWRNTGSRETFDLNAEMREAFHRDGAPEASKIIVHDR